MKMERKNAWKEYTEAEISELEKLNESYRKFLDAGKTERECVKQAVAMAEAAGYLDLKKVIEEGKQVKAVDKLYAVNMKKGCVKLWYMYFLQTDLKKLKPLNRLIYCAEAVLK